MIVGGIAFIVLLLFGGLSSCSLFGGNSGSGLIASSYLSEDADITGAESAYAAMEAELQDMLDNIESEYPGYDEYRVNADEIEHDPYVLTFYPFLRGIRSARLLHSMKCKAPLKCSLRNSIS